MRTIEEFIEATDKGRIFSVLFVKRTTGETRLMNCRRGVIKHAKGGELAYDPAKLKLLPVYDLQTEAYRQISLDAIISVKIEGRTYHMVEGEFRELETV